MLWICGLEPSDADCLYVHDVAVLPEVRGMGLQNVMSI